MNALTFHDIYNYCDALLSEAFEGIEMRYDFSEEEWMYVRETQKYQMLLIYPENANIYQSKLLRKMYTNFETKVK